MFIGSEKINVENTFTNYYKSVIQHRFICVGYKKTHVVKLAMLFFKLLPNFFKALTTFFIKSPLM